MEAKPEIIALDATISSRPKGQKLDEFFHEIKEKYPDQLLMADCSTIEEALHADELGFDFIQNKARILKSMKMILKS